MSEPSIDDMIETRTRQVERLNLYLGGFYSIPLLPDERPSDQFRYATVGMFYLQQDIEIMKGTRQPLSMDGWRPNYEA